MAKSLRKPIWAAAVLLLCVGAGVYGVSVASRDARPGLTRGPYLQMATPHSIHIRWRTGEPSTSVVRFGEGGGKLERSARAQGKTTEHDVLVDGLEPARAYTYRVGTTSTSWEGGGPYGFRTPPAVGKAVPTRVLILGDSGTGDDGAREVREAYEYYAKSHGPADVWLMLGDNAYYFGTDDEYQEGVFEMYPSLLRRRALWPALGNHDARTADSDDQSGPYYDIFTLPTDGQAGGVASHTEAYYSFDYANIHFVCLDSADSDLSADGPMAQWLRRDLEATGQTWRVVFFHHPPYSKGSHDSDDGERMTAMRQNFAPILEEYGVDLVFSGHSHDYERSYLIDGHYGDSASFASSNRVGADGEYGKNWSWKTKRGPHHGTIYVVAGSAAKHSGGPLDHPAMAVSQDRMGFVMLEIDGDKLEATFVHADGSKGDHFELEKLPKQTAN